MKVLAQTGNLNDLPFDEKRGIKDKFNEKVREYTGMNIYDIVLPKNMIKRCDEENYEDKVKEFEVNGFILRCECTNGHTLLRKSALS